jgi:ATP-binding cassette subfamily C protein
MGAATVFAGIELFKLPAPILITLLVVLSRMSALAATVQHGAQQISYSLPSHAAILALEAELTPVGTPGVSRRGAQIPSASEALVFDGVSFAHGALPGSAPKGFSLTLPAGAFVGLVGPSGVGKTTFLDLAAGVLRPQSGTIHAFGRELAGDALARHRRGLAYVAQDAFLFDDTIRSNLAWAAPGRSQAELAEALERVGAGNLLRRLPSGLDTRVGHRGALISAGERQRLALAAALLRQPRLLLLDEATNAIDIAGEGLILEAIAALRPQTTILMVAHRTETLRLCDRILEFPGPAMRVLAPAVRRAS